MRVAVDGTNLQLLPASKQLAAENDVDFVRREVPIVFLNDQVAEIVAAVAERVALGAIAAEIAALIVVDSVAGHFEVVLLVVGEVVDVLEVGAKFASAAV